MTKLHVPAKPCESCPYRRDVPPGVWHAEEYQRLRRYDDPQECFNTFLCHHSPGMGQEAVCRGWLTVHLRERSQGPNAEKRSPFAW